MLKSKETTREVVVCPECKKQCTQPYEKKYVKDFGMCISCEDKVVAGQKTFRDELLYF